MNKKALGLMIVGGLLIVTGCGRIPKLENGQEIIAKIDGKEITANEVYEDLKKQYGTGIIINMIDDYIANKEIKTDDDAKEHAQVQLDQIKLNFENEGNDFQAALQSSGFKNEQELLDAFIADYKKNKVTENFIKEKITAKEIEKYYNEEISEEMDVRHILIQPKEVQDEEIQKIENQNALKKANDLIKQLNEGANFEELAKEHSADGSKDDGGLIKNVNKEKYVIEFFEAAQKLEKNKYTTEPVKSQFGYHIILKLDTKPKASLEETKDYIVDKLVENKLAMNQDLDKEVWTEIRKKYNLNIFDKDVKINYDLITSSLNK